MPTQSKLPVPGQWSARTDTPRRSIFGNYRPDPAREADSPPAGAMSPGRPSGEASRDPAALDRAMARAFLYRFLAKAYEDPTAEAWAWLGDAATQASLNAARSTAGMDATSPLPFEPSGFESFYAAYLAVFGHAARGSCPSNEIEYGDIKADPLFQPHRLADLAAFYRAFGLEVAENAGERQDHICLELEFMCVLAAREAWALEHGLTGEQLAQCRDAQKTFLREHLGRWTPAFARRLAASTSEPLLSALAHFTRAFVESDCHRFGVSPGSEDLFLRPVDESAESMCASCGIHQLPPGAASPT